MDEQKIAGLTAEADGVIEGRNAVIEALRAGETIDKIYLQKGETDKTPMPTRGSSPWRPCGSMSAWRASSRAPPIRGKIPCW